MGTLVSNAVEVKKAVEGKELVGLELAWEALMNLVGRTAEAMRTTS